MSLAALLLEFALPVPAAAAQQVASYEEALLEVVRRESGAAGVQQMDQELGGLATQAETSGIRLRRWFFEEAHFVGEGAAPQASPPAAPAPSASRSLVETVQSRRGPCLALAAVYLALTERLAGKAVPIATPRHVFIREIVGESAVTDRTATHGAVADGVNVELLERGKNHPERYYLLQENAPPNDPQAAHLLRQLTPAQFLAYLLNNRAVHLRAGGDNEAAESAYREALKLDGDCQPCHYNYGNLLAAEGKMKKAQRHYDRALELHPWDEEAERNRALLP